VANHRALAASLIALTLVACLPARGDDLPVVSGVALQPLGAHARALADALEAAGSPLPRETRAGIDAAGGAGDEAAGVRAIQAALDPLCLLGVEINPEARVKVARGPANAELIEQGWRAVLVKVHNAAGLTGPLAATSPQAGQLANSPEPAIRDKWIELAPYTARPLQPNLTGLELEYRVFQLFSRDAGKRQATLSLSAGRGTKDLGSRGEIDMLFDCAPSRDVTFRVRDAGGAPSVACVVIKDTAGRVYPLQSKRLAPDFFFHPQVYRLDGETVKLPPGRYTLESSRGPETVPVTQELIVADAPATVDVKISNWIDPTKFGYYSGDHHIHAAGCAHYTKPTEGVHAKDMIRHVLGEDLKVGCNLTWGPCFDYQKQFFTGKDDPVSRPGNLLRYDVEVSGFGSHRSGHLVLLRLKNMMYPGGDSSLHWPTLGLNTLKWAKAQGAVCGPAHSGNGIAVKDNQLPSYAIPNYDGIGANEFVVDVTHEVPGPDGKPVPAVDFISTVDTEPRAELNMWYHVLNCGYRTRASGETDFPCIYGERVGMGRSYVRLDGNLNFDAWCDGVQKGRSYVSDGKSHLVDVKVGDVEVGMNGSELKLPAPGTVKVTAKVAAWLAERPPAGGRLPVWHVERARIPNTRDVKIEAVVNGQVVGEKTVTADGALRDLAFDVKLERPSWVALRIFPSSHSNPVFVVIDGKPIRASKRSAQWCLDGVDKCWSQKQRFYAPAEQAAAVAAYDHARAAYRKILAECDGN
jgi:hypothetical protein